MCTNHVYNRKSAKKFTNVEWHVSFFAKELNIVHNI